MSTRRIRETGALGRTSKIPVQTAMTETVWVRNPCWPVLPTVTASDEKLIGLVAVMQTDSTFVSFTCAGNYTVNWGDGLTENVTTGVQANHEYVYSDVDLVNTNGPVTFTDAGELVTRTSHGYINGMRVQFYNIVSTTGLTEAQTYFVISATTNTFQVSLSLGGAAVVLTTNGSATLLDYKIAQITITPNASTLTSVSLAKQHTTYTGSSAYAGAWLDISLSLPNATGATGLVIGNNSSVAPANLQLERVRIYSWGAATAASYLFYNCNVLAYVELPTTSSSLNTTFAMFYGCSRLPTVPMFSTTGVTTTANMFYGCSSLVSAPTLLALACTTTANMFYGCSSLASAPPIVFDASLGITSSMFFGCSSLVVVPPYYVNSVTQMDSMFSGCSSLVSAPPLVTANAVLMNNMFKDCYSLVDVPVYSLVSATTAASMFSGCGWLERVRFSGTQLGLTTTSSMFSGCSSLLEAPEITTDVSLVNTASMFNGCSRMTSVSLFDTTAASDMSSMFLNCSSLTSVPLFVTTNNATLASMFQGCVKLQTVPAFNISNATSAASMFAGCSSLLSAPLGASVLYLTTTNNMFLNCSSLVDAPPLTTDASLLSTNNMFQGCTSLRSVPLYVTSGVTDMGSMFQSCSSLTTIPAFNTAQVTTFVSMFSGCTALTACPTMSVAATASSAAHTNMFYNCPSLASVKIPPKFTFTIAQGKMSAAALNALYTLLPSIAGQTITITGNFGAASDTPATATGKGWTVTG